MRVKAGLGLALGLSVKPGNKYLCPPSQALKGFRYVPVGVTTVTSFTPS